MAARHADAVGGATDDVVPARLSGRQPRSPGLRPLDASSRPASGPREDRGDRLPSLAVGPSDRLLVFAPHPDDEALAAGILLRRAVAAGAAVRVVLATDGEANVWVERWVERRFRVDAALRARFAKRRRAEALAALSRVSVAAADVRFLALPDAGLTEAFLSAPDALGAALAAEIASFHPTLVVSPSILDLHPDHSAIAAALRSTAPPAARERRFLEYVVHGDAGRDAAAVLVPTRAEREAKRAAVLCHVAPMAVHRREFLAHASRAERFVDPDAAHPLIEARIEGDALEIAVRSHPRLGAFGRATLILLARGTRGGWTCLRVSLKGWRGTVPVLRGGGGVEAAQATVSRRGARRIVRIPAGVLGGAERVLAKVERRFGFYDEAGWLEIRTATVPAGPAAAPAPPPPPRGGTVAVVPCYDVARWCGDVVRRTSAVVDRVFAVDDGSRDGTDRVLGAAAAESGGRVEVLTFPENRGKGAALLAGFARAVESVPFDVLVTLDGDGQHAPEDVPAVSEACRRGADLAIGGRRAFRRMPFPSRLGNRATAALLRCVHPRCPRDTQSGLRALSRPFVEEVLREVGGVRYETEMRVLLLALSRRRKVAEVPIATRYETGNASSHFRPVLDSARVWRTLLGDLVRAARGGGQEAGGR